MRDRRSAHELFEAWKNDRGQKSLATASDAFRLKIENVTPEATSVDAAAESDQIEMAAVLETMVTRSFLTVVTAKFVIVALHVIHG